MDKFDWCISKNFFEIVESNQNLSKAYLEKAKNSLDAVSKLTGNIEWEISSAYYAIYFSLYAILMKIGVKCENHACTIELIDKFISQFSDKDILFFKKARTSRVDLQYYIDRDIDEMTRKEIIARAPAVYIKCKEIINMMTEEDINELRGRAQKAFKSQL